MIMKPTVRHALDFAFMFTACLVGSVAIFIFAVGMETGNNAINQMMRSLVDNVMWVLAAFVFFNVFMFLIYFRNKKGKAV